MRDFVVGGDISVGTSRIILAKISKGEEQVVCI